MRRSESGGVVFYRFENLSAAGLSHAVFTRLGGVSGGHFESLNLSFAVGDDPELVRRNRALAAEVIGVEGLASAHQVHGTCALKLAAPFEGAGGPERHQADILLTDRPGLGLMIKQADCQAVLLYDPERRALANVHCGWRGSVAGALGRAVADMREAFGSRPEALLAAIAPSLGPCCAEFRHWREELPPELWPFRVGEDHFDFWRLSTHQLVAAGLRSEAVEVSGICTRCSAEFYSYRREGKTGRFATIGSL